MAIYSDSTSARTGRTPVMTAHEGECGADRQHSYGRVRAFLAFRTITTATIIGSVYPAGAMLIIIGSVFAIVVAAFSETMDFPDYRLRFLLVMGVMFAGNILWWFFCEGIIRFLKKHDT